MKFKFKYTNKIVGVFMLVALGLLIGSLILITIQQKVFVKKYVFKARFLDAEGLSTSTPIRFKGYEIGRITQFRLNEENTIDADFTVVEEYRTKIVENSALNKAKNPISGASTIELLQGPDPQKILPEGGLIPSIEIPEGRRLVDEGLVIKTGDVISSMLVNTDRLLENLNRDNNEKSGALFRALVNLADASEKLDKTMDQISVTFDKFNRDGNPQDGAIFRALKNMADLTEQLQTTTALINKSLIKSDTLMSAYANPNGLVVKLADPKGENFIKPINETLKNLNYSLTEMGKMLVFLNEQQPELSGVISEGKQTLSTAQKTLEGINNNPLIRGGIQSESEKEIQGSKLRPKHTK
ncbi:MAG: MlaD family protein [Bacteroidetes bacterium]|nr:MlaD family protein [Bacteroidota bacterium]